MTGPVGDPQFGTCTAEDFDLLSLAVLRLGKAEADVVQARSTVGAAMRTMLEKGALRKAVASFAGVSDQTVTNLALGRRREKNGVSDG